MKKIKNSAIAMTVIFIFQIFSGIKPINIAKADETKKFSFITGVTISDLQDRPLKDGIDKSSQVRIKYSFAIPNANDVKDGEVFKMNMPKQIAIQYPLDMDIKDDDGNVIAKAHFDTNGEITIVFTNYASTHSNIDGYFYIDTIFDRDNIGDINPEKIVFELGGDAEPVVIDVNFDQPEQPSTSIEKTGSYDASKNEITWNVKVNNERVTVNNAQLIDNIPIGQEYVEGSATIDNGADASGFTYEKATNGNSDKTGTLIYKFKDTINDVYNVTFKTKVTDPKVFETEGASTDIYNKAILNHDGTEITSNTAYVTVTTDYIDKSGKYVEIRNQDGTVTRRIEWTINVNNNGLTLTNPKITDNIPVGLKLTDGSFKVNGQPTSGYVYNNNVLEYTFPGTIDKPQVITFSTDIIDKEAHESNDWKVYTNTASISGNGINGEPSANSNEVGVPSYVIEKSGIEYDPSTHHIKWQIIVNRNMINIENAVITDNIPMGQKYVEGSATIDGGADINGFTYIPANKDDKEKTGTLKYEFKGPINKYYVITFKTEVTDNNIFSGNIANEKYYNTATLTGSNLSKPSSSTGTQDVSSEVIKKNIENYDYITNELTWSIRVNKNAMKMKNVVVTDNIPIGQEYVEGSATIDKGADVKKFSYKKADDNDSVKTGTLTYTFPNEINETYIITFKTKITDLTIFHSNGDKTIKNKAELSGDLVPPNVSSEASKTVSNAIIDKSADYKIGNDYIDWNIDINSNSIQLDDAKVQDILQEGLELDTTSVELYNQTLNSNGTLTKGEKVELDENNVKYDSIKREFIFNFPGPVNSPYLLTFRTNVTDKSKSPFKNTASFIGSKTIEEGTSGSVNVVFQGGGSGGIGEKGSITISKVDSDDNSKKLQGAKFNLLDKYKNIVSTGITDENGSLTFDKIKYDIPYYVQEITPPIGYTLTNQEGFKDGLYEFNISSKSDIKNIKYVWKNNIIKGGIKILKVDSETSKAVKGATISIYTNDDKLVDAKITAEDGTIEFNDLVYGDYYFVETKAPEGYLLNNNKYYFSIKDDGVILKDTLTNEKITGRVEVIKKSEDGNYLSDAEFTLFDANGKEVKKAITDLNGLAIFNDIPYGSYTIKETRAPKGFNLSDEILNAEVNGTETGKTYKAGTITDTKIKASIKIKKLDQDGKVLQGAEFTLYDSNNNALKTVVSDKDGIIVFNDVLYGEYYIKETKAPEGYVSSSDIIKVSIMENGVVYYYEVENTRIKGTIEIKKVDNNGNVLEGAEFTLYDKDGKAIVTAISDANGIARFEAVDYGRYTIKETRAPEGYNISDEILNVEVNGTETGKTYKAGTITDTKIKAAIKIKKLDQDGKVLQGAEFTLYDSNNNALETVVSDKDGVIVFNDVIYGDYYIKETKAPDGYVASSDIIKVSIIENGVVYYYEVENTRIKGTIEIKKVDNNGNVLEGAEFTLYDKDSKAIVTAISDANGIARFEAVDYGIYTIKETKAPNGYKISDEEIKVEITSSEKKVFNFKNDKIKNENINESSNESSNKNTNEDKLLPKTGSAFDVRILLLIGLLAIGLGSVFLFKRKASE
jgi:LPXTG-motif cell wall-anchored protein/uncharacterized repeat protein (TIGR01451 family)